VRVSMVLNLRLRPTFGLESGNNSGLLKTTVETKIMALRSSGNVWSRDGDKLLYRDWSGQCARVSVSRWWGECHEVVACVSVCVLLLELVVRFTTVRTTDFYVDTYHDS